ncbi:hypothetical protein, partial [Herbaspirillum chlorophenolicum]
MSNVINVRYKIAVKTTVRGRTYYAELPISLRELHIPRKSWIAEQLHILQAQSEVAALLRHDIDCYLTVIKMLAQNEAGLEMLSLPANKVGRHVLYRLFSLEEQLLHPTDRTDEGKSKVSSSFRKCVIDLAQEQKLKDDEITRRSIGFQSSLTGRAGPRSLISDVTDKSLDPDLAAPISALSHKDAKDLVVKTRERLEYDLVTIQDACVRELETCKAIRERLIALGKTKCSRGMVNLVADMLSAEKYPLKGHQAAVGELSTDMLFAGYQKVIARDGLAKVERPYSPVFWKNKNRLEDFLGAGEKHLVGPGSRIHYLPYRMIAPELVAAFVLLLSYTAWNGHTLQAMGADDVVVKGDWVTLKGYKGKIDSFVTDAHLDIKQPGLKLAIDLILWNRKQLIKLGFLPKNSQLLWCTWSTYYGPIEFQYVGFQDGLKKFQKAYSLPSFSLDQVRPQVMAYESLKGKNPDHVRQLASHKKLSTTGHYLDQILMRSLNSAINLEFQRRMENTVIFRLAEKDSAFEPLVRMKHVDLRLLTPLGDGSSCRNPAEPPDEEFMIGNMCDGNRCHVGEGCENRMVVIDMENLAALIRKRRFYRMNWRRLEAKNSA